MFLGINWEPILPIISAALVMGTVVVGIMGLYSDHHVKDRKLTRSGWAVAALMIVLGIGSIVFGAANQKVADRKAREESDHRDAQFQRQMATLQSATGSLTALQGDMASSLRSQRDLYRIADRTLGMSAVLQRQAQANTDAVLRRVFAESNRIAAERIAISVMYECNLPHEDSDNPQLSTAALWIKNPSGDLVILTSNQKLTTTGVLYTFYGFLGDLGPFDTFDAWRNATVSIQLTAQTPPGGAMTLDQVFRLDQLRRQRHGRRPDPPECRASVGLLLNGREVLRARKTFEPGGGGFYVTDLAPMRVNPARLPRF